MGLPFFMIGYVLIFLKNKYRDISNKKLIHVLIIFVICFFAEIFFVLEFNLKRDIILTFFLYPLLISIMLLLINTPLLDKQNIAYRYRVMANFTYYVHPIIIILLSKFFNLTNLNVKETVTYFIVCFITTTLGFIIVKMDNQYINKIVV
jgi:peptidoglycan/LPS O-acetylase OafA/YrhL